MEIFEAVPKGAKLPNITEMVSASIDIMLKQRSNVIKHNEFNMITLVNELDDY